MFRVEKHVKFDDLTEEEQEDVPNNGNGKEEANYIRIIDEEGTRVYGDAMDPEDATFKRDLDWIKDELEKAYTQGRIDEYQSNH